MLPFCENIMLIKVLFIAVVLVSAVKTASMTTCPVNSRHIALCFFPHKDSQTPWPARTKSVEFRGLSVDEISAYLKDAKDITRIMIHDSNDENGKITKFPADFFQGVPHLKSLTVNTLRLAQLPDGFAEALKGKVELTHLNLEQNRVNCDCTLSWLVKRQQINIKAPEKLRPARYCVQNGFERDHYTAIELFQICGSKINPPRNKTQLQPWFGAVSSSIDIYDYDASWLLDYEQIEEESWFDLDYEPVDEDYSMKYDFQEINFEHYEGEDKELHEKHGVYFQSGAPYGIDLTKTRTRPRFDYRKNILGAGRPSTTEPTAIENNIGLREQPTAIENARGPTDQLTVIENKTQQPTEKEDETSRSKQSSIIEDGTEHVSKTIPYIEVDGGNGSNDKLIQYIKSSGTRESPMFRAKGPTMILGPQEVDIFIDYLRHKKELFK